MNKLPVDSLHAQPDTDYVFFKDAAARRAIDHYLKPDVSPTQLEDRFFSAKTGINPEDALIHASDLLRSAAAIAYESASRGQGMCRDFAFSLVYMIDMARTMVERSLETPTNPLKSDSQAAL